MPRTKAPRRRTTVKDGPSLTEEQKKLKQTVNMLYETKKKILQEDYEAKKKQLKQNFEMLREGLQLELNKTMGQVREEATRKAASVVESHTNSKSITNIRVSLSSLKDDGYVTDAVNANKNPVRKSRRLSRSVSRSNFSAHQSKIRTPSVMGPRLHARSRRSSSASSAMGPPRTTRPRYRTPMNRVHGAAQYPPITPKIVPDTPMTVLRRPRQGETVISLSGSPLIVDSNSDFHANCNIPLADGTVVSLLPNKMKDSSVLNVPIDQMRPETRRELTTLKDNLQTYLKMMAAQNKKY